MWFHDNLDILIEPHQQAQQPFDGELAELAAQHLRHIGLADSKQFSGLNMQPLLIAECATPPVEKPA